MKELDKMPIVSETTSHCSRLGQNWRIMAAESDSEDTRIPFGSLPVGTKFRWRRTLYSKTGRSSALDDQKLETIFLNSTRVELVEEPYRGEEP
jgi:hypothetical protein